MGKGIECEAVHGHIDRGREKRPLVEANPVDIVVIRHGLLNYSNTHPLTSPFILTEQLLKYHYSGHQQTTNPWRRGDRRGIEEDDWGSGGALRDRFQPDTEDPLTS
jgi:hypothetical protein